MYSHVCKVNTEVDSAHRGEPVLSVRVEERQEPSLTDCLAVEEEILYSQAV